IRQVIWEVARADDAVIVGRGAACILETHPDVLHVLVTAPLEIRVERIMATEKLDHEHALQKVKQVDANRERYIRHFYRANWLEVGLYDVALSTGHFSQITAVTLLETAIRADRPA